jgi:hypothetical protein
MAPLLLTVAQRASEWPALPPGKKPAGIHWVGPQCRSGHCGEEGNVAPAGNRTPLV